MKSVSRDCGSSLNGHLRLMCAKARKDTGGMERKKKKKKSVLARKVKEMNEVSDLLVNEDAERYGPLTKNALEEAREKAAYDPRNPLRPLRIEPVGVVAPDSEDFKAFRKAAFDNDYMIRLVDNPKQQGKESWKRYQKYQVANTLREIVELSATSKNAAKRKEQKALAMKDIANDAVRGYILFPQHENKSPSHYVNALSIAKMFSTVSIHCLYSTEELKDKRTERMNEIYSEYKNRIVSKRTEKKSSTALLSFQEQLESLWEYDEVLDRIESRLQYETYYGAAAVSELLCGDIPDPKHYKSATAANHPERNEWLESMKRERKTLQDRKTWELVKRKSIGHHKPVKCKYVYRKKRNKDSSLQYKSRLVGCGYSQIPGVDFHADELYAGVCSYSSMRFLMSYACGKGYILSQSDITGAYLEAPVTETIYMEPPPDMFVDSKPPVDEDGDEVVCLLKRSLYGLKSSGFAWSECFKEFMLKDKKYNMGFKQFTGEPNLYRKTFDLNGKIEEIVVGIYVDDCLIASSSEEARQWFMKRIGDRFPVNQKSSGLITMKDPGLVLSMNVRYDIKKGILQFDQKQSIELLAKKFEVINQKPRSLPFTHDIKLPKLKEAEVSQTDYLSIIGSCLHISQVSRPDISYSVGVLSRHSATPGKEHMKVALDLVNYLYNTKELSIQYNRESDGEMKIYEKASELEDLEKTSSLLEKSIEQRLEASEPPKLSNELNMFADADYAGDRNTRRSTSGMIIMMNGGPISWLSRLQKLCALSTAEAEIYAVTESVKEAIHMKLLCEECGIRKMNRPMTVYEDNNACIHMGHGLRGSKAAKHYEVRLRFLHENVRNKVIEFARISTKKQLADGFTKALPGPAFKDFRSKVLVDPNVETINNTA
mmetsp:Transcript_10938/g.14234  ORF Transcript_10938/g.14234 Transcript_10938/m.14234 type:complete len:883 (-) Transcript_10938:637-3285(-)